MKVEFFQRQTLDLPEAECNRVTRETLLKLLGWQEDYHIDREGYLCNWSSPSPHNGDQDSERLHKATKLDQFLIELLKKLH